MNIKKMFTRLLSKIAQLNKKNEIVSLNRDCDLSNLFTQLQNYYHRVLMFRFKHINFKSLVVS